MPELILPTRFQSPPYNGDYYKILGLNPESSLRTRAVIDAYHTMALIYHPDNISTSLTNPPLTMEEKEEAVECFKAIGKIMSIFLFKCVDAIQEEKLTISVPKDVQSADDLSPEEQLKACMLKHQLSTRFCIYPDEGAARPGVPGYWVYVEPNGTKIGTSRFSGKLAIATLNYQVEVPGRPTQPVIVFDKNTKPFTPISDPATIRSVLEQVADTIPKSHRDVSAKIYGNMVRNRKPASEYPVTMFKKPVVEIKEPFVIDDVQGDNFADGIRKNPDNSFTIWGRNRSNQPRQLTLFQDGRAVGYQPGVPLGIVEHQFFENKTGIFSHFGLNINEAIPGFAKRLRPL